MSNVCSMQIYRIGKKREINKTKANNAMFKLEKKKKKKKLLVMTTTTVLILFIFYLC